MKEEREHLRLFIDNHGIARVPAGSRELVAHPDDPPGTYYVWQFYLRSSLLRPRALNFIQAWFWEHFMGMFRERPFQIAGVEQASVPIITAILCGSIAHGINLNAFTIRKERKTYGLGNDIEGEPNELPVLLVDDLTSTTHKTIWQAIRIIKEHGMVLAPKCFVVVMKGRDAGVVLPTSIGFTEVVPIYTLRDFTMLFEDKMRQQTIREAEAP